MSEERILERSGYGASFNRITIHENSLVKKPFTSHGIEKLENEAFAYEVFSKEVPEFPMAELLASKENTLTLRYYADCVPLWTVYKEMGFLDKTNTLADIFSYLDILHSTKHISLSKKEYTELFYSEVIEKVKARYIEIKELLHNAPFSHVNGIDCLSFEAALKRVEQHFYRYINSKQTFELTYIHGDPQFSNILYNTTTKKLIFIDPRGYFGNKKLYGAQEYDLAKVVFALSGYDIFDNMSFSEISIEEGNITIPIFVVDERYKTLCPQLHFLLVSIWLANCHTFKDNPNKAIISHAYARYLATILL
jgi:hypothetical protein